VHQDDPHPEVLHLGHDLGEILLGASDDRFADRPVPGQRDQVPMHLADHALAPARAHPGQPKLESGDVGQRLVLGSQAGVGGDLIPVAAQHRHAATIASQPCEKLYEARVIPCDRVPLTGAVNSHGSVTEHIASVHEQRASVHAIPPFPLDARRYQRCGVVVT
jgi:hypothetical protein